MEVIMKNISVIFLVILFVTTACGFVLAQGTTVRSLNSDEELANIRTRREAERNVKPPMRVTHTITRGPHWDISDGGQQENPIDSKRAKLIDELQKTASSGMAPLDKKYKIQALSNALDALNGSHTSYGSNPAATNTRASVPANINNTPRGAIDVMSGQYYAPTAGGVVDPRDGTFHAQTAGGYVNTKTGQFSPQIGQ